MPTQCSHIQNVMGRIKAIEGEDLKKKLNQALDESIKLHPGSTSAAKKCKSPSEIAQRYIIDISQLKEYGIIVDYIGGVDFLESIGFCIPLRSVCKDKYKAFRNKYHSSIFQNIFGRTPDKERTFVYTYAEIMYLVNNPVIIILK